MSFKIADPSCVQYLIAYLSIDVFFSSVIEHRSVESEDMSLVRDFNGLHLLFFDAYKFISCKGWMGSKTWYRFVIAFAWRSNPSILLEEVNF